MARGLGAEAQASEVRHRESTGVACHEDTLRGASMTQLRESRKSLSLPQRQEIIVMWPWTHRSQDLTFVKAMVGQAAAVDCSAKAGITGWPPQRLALLLEAEPDTTEVWDPRVGICQPVSHHQSLLKCSRQGKDATTVLIPVVARIIKLWASCSSLPTPLWEAIQLASAWRTHNIGPVPLGELCDLIQAGANSCRPWATTGTPLTHQLCLL